MLFIYKEKWLLLPPCLPNHDTVFFTIKKKNPHFPNKEAPEMLKLHGNSRIRMVLGRKGCPSQYHLALNKSRQHLSEMRRTVSSTFNSIW